MKILINKAIPEIGIELLKEQGLSIIHPQDEEFTKEEVHHHLQNCDAFLSVGSDNVLDRKFFEKYSNIKAVSLYSVGFNNVDIEEATRRKIPVGNTPDVLSKATSDIAFLLMQMVARKASYNIEKVKSGNWKNFDALEHLGQELYGKTLGIYGLGRIGLEMAKKAKAAFEMEIIYHNRSPKPEMEKTLDARYVPFDELIEKANVLSIHASYTPGQNEIFNASVFEKMRPDSIFINTARGGFHNENDLFDALRSSKIWGAGLDVTNPEPATQNNPLLSLPNVCIFPHIGSATVEARNGMAILAAKNLIAFSKGEIMPNCVNPTVAHKPKGQTT